MTDPKTIDSDDPDDKDEPEQPDTDGRLPEVIFGEPEE